MNRGRSGRHRSARTDQNFAAVHRQLRYHPQETSEDEMWPSSLSLSHSHSSWASGCWPEYLLKMSESTKLWWKIKSSYKTGIWVLCFCLYSRVFHLESSYAHYVYCVLLKSGPTALLRMIFNTMVFSVMYDPGNIPNVSLKS